MNAGQAGFTKGSWGKGDERKDRRNEREKGRARAICKSADSVAIAESG